MFRLDDFRGRGDQIEIGMDASIWGLGAWMAVNGTIVKHFHSKVSKHDIAMFNLKGTCDDQQVLECLAILVAIRAWMPSSKQRVQLAPRIRGDNIGALTTVIKMRPKTPRMAIIAEEIAVHLVHYSFPPAVYHTPGLAHVVAGQLSRINDPSKPEAIKV